MKDFKKLRQAGVPLAAISTADPAATIAVCVKTLGKKDDQPPVACWDLLRGIVGVNQRGADMCAGISPDGAIQSGNPSECLSLLAKLDKKYDDCVVFFSNADKFIENEGVLQGVWNLRDIFKAKHCTLVLLCPGITLPPALKQDIIVIDEPLPDADELERIAKSVVEDSGIGEDKLNGDLPAVVDTMRGLSAFAAEQVLALSLSKQGIDMSALRKLKRTYISQTPGIEVREDKTTFDDIAGYGTVKNLLRRKIEGKRPPRLVIWWDEFDRTIAGNATDTSGTSQDQMAVLLQFLQDRLNEDRLSAMILVGVPGSAKSMFASAAHNEANCECLRWDMGGMKDSLVGNSEKRIRNALKVTDAMSGGHILVIATANNLKGVPSPVINRFALGVYYFPLPTKEEGDAIWALKRKKYGLLNDDPNPTDAPLTGREINQCCFIADDLKLPLSEAIKYITPYYMTNQAEVESLNTQAHKRWLSASQIGFYHKPSEQPGPSRRMQVVDV